MAHVHRTDYDAIAETYARLRRPVPCKIDALARALRARPRVVAIEAGCGTGDYIRALSGANAGIQFIGLDLSASMLREARGRGAALIRGCAEEGWPVAVKSADFIYAVDVLHHLGDVPRFFREAAAALRTPGTLAVITDSEEDIRGRSLADFFPETLPINLARYPPLGNLRDAAAVSGLMLARTESLHWSAEISDSFVAVLDEKALSELRLIPAEAHAAGMARVRRAQGSGGEWLSRTTMLVFEHLEDRRGVNVREAGS